VNNVIKVDFVEEHRRRAREQRNEHHRDGIFKIFLFIVPAVIIISIGILTVASLLTLILR